MQRSPLPSEPTPAVDAYGPGQGPVLVTGGAGFIGSAVVEGLHYQGFTVRVFELPGVDASHLPKGVTVIRGDITRAADVRVAVSGCGAVMHLAANPNLYHPDPQALDRVNHRGTSHVLDAATAANVHRIIHVSTESILALPDAQPQSLKGPMATEQTQLPLSQMFGPYLQSKWRAEEAARQAAAAGRPVIIVIPSIPIGPGDRRGVPLTRLIRQLGRGRIKGALPGTINVIDVRDLATAMVHALRLGVVGRRYLLSGHNLTYAQLFDAVSRVSGVAPPRWEVPYRLALAFAYIEEWFCRTVSGDTPLATVAGVKLTRRAFRFDASRSQAELGWPLRPLDASLHDMVLWMAERGELGDVAIAALDAGAE